MLFPPRSWLLRGRAPDALIQNNSGLHHPFYSCSRESAAVRWRAFCVGRTRVYYSTVFAPVRRVPPILLRQRCDGRNKRGEKMACGSGLTRGTVSLTHRSIEALRPGETPYRVPDQRCIGLAVRVAPSGVKTWGLAYRIRGSGEMGRGSLRAVSRVSPLR